MRGKGQISCPVGGCSGRWMKNHIAVDDNFLRKIKKFERQQTLRSQVLGQFRGRREAVHSHGVRAQWHPVRLL